MAPSERFQRFSPAGDQVARALSELDSSSFCASALVIGRRYWESSSRSWALAAFCGS
jgi:hypothetical protein